ncbi:HD domain-containing protein [Desulfoplanes sp.]
MQIYLVGGAVRDGLLGRPVHDRDYTVIGADKETFMQAFPHARPVGKKVPVYYVDGDEYTLSGAATIQEDLLERDLTINALAKDARGRIIAHPRALEHLEEKLLYPVSGANFFVDPARVFRAARFVACLPGFCAHPELERLMHRVVAAGGTGTLPAERVGKELLAGLACPVPAMFLRMCQKVGALSVWFEELERGVTIPAGPRPFHDGSVFEHSCQVMDRLAGDPLLVWMGLCHDLGKTVTDPGLWPAHHGHDRAGVDIAQKMGGRLRLPGAMVRAGMAAARWHMVLARYGQLRPGTRVDLLGAVGSEKLLARLCALTVADGGEEVTALVLRDLKIVKQVHLSKPWQGLGKRSGEHLREMRAQALADAASDSG